jgi:hypothetical protein
LPVTASGDNNGESADHADFADSNSQGNNSGNKDPAPAEAGTPNAA